MRHKKYICEKCFVPTVYGREGGNCGYCGGRLKIWDGKPIIKESLIGRPVIKENRLKV